MTTREAVLAPEVDPAEAGLDPERLQRIDRHFARYVDDGRLPGYLAVVARDGAIVHVASGGRRDLESGAPVEPDTVWRIYSMTKPITTVAAMMLFEEGAFQLTDPVADLIPAFGDARVYLRGSATKPLTVPMAEPMRLWHLMTHTSGLTYGFHHTHANLGAAIVGDAIEVREQSLGQLFERLQPLPAQLIHPSLQIIEHGPWVGVVPQAGQAFLE